MSRMFILQYSVPGAYSATKPTENWGNPLSRAGWRSWSSSLGNAPVLVDIYMQLALYGFLLSCFHLEALYSSWRYISLQIRPRCVRPCQRSLSCALHKCEKRSRSRTPYCFIRKEKKGWLFRGDPRNEYNPEGCGGVLGVWADGEGDGEERGTGSGWGTSNSPIS